MLNEKPITRTEKIPGFFWGRVRYCGLRKLFKMGFPIVILLLALYFLYCGIMLCQNFFGPTRAEHIPELNEKSVDDVLGKLGKPESTYFTTADRVILMHDLIHHFYPQDKPGNGKVEIMIMNWERFCFYIRIWFHKVDGEWVVLHTLKWRKGHEF